MLENVIKQLERTEDLKRRDSEVTTSTVETFVSERPVFTLDVPESGKEKTEVGDVERNAQELQPNKGWCFHFYHKHTGAIAILGIRQHQQIPNIYEMINLTVNSNNFQYLYPSSWLDLPC